MTANRGGPLTHLSPELRSLVSHSTALLGEVIERQLGRSGYERIEKIRREMAKLRDQPRPEALVTLAEDLQKLPAKARHHIATAFTLMLELMNTCENAYRSRRLGGRPEFTADTSALSAVVYVLTAHPTEARAPGNIAVFHEIQAVLLKILAQTPDGQDVRPSLTQMQELTHWLEVAWSTPIVRNRAPKVRDEAEHVDTMALREEVLEDLLKFGEEKVPFYLRSWVGGDKDGHPGVDEKVLLQCLNESRAKLQTWALANCRSIRRTLDFFPSAELRGKLSRMESHFRKIKTVGAGDGLKIANLRAAVGDFASSYEKFLHDQHPAFRSLRRLLHVFPALVTPLELRESSDVLMAKPARGPAPAIDRMLAMVAKVARGGDPRWYARGFIISMTESAEHLRVAGHKQKKAFGEFRLPIIPLFEEAGSLADAEKIMTEVLEDPALSKAVRKYWGGLVEMMVGYSDSSKEAGVFPSRWAISRALPRLEKLCLEKGFTPVFFHGSGGSVDRGGGSVEDQTAWWPASALKHYKVTVQGEMVERSFATKEIALGQVQHIAESALKGLRRNPTDRVPAKALPEFAAAVSKSYEERIKDPAFLDLVEKVTPYSYLSVLKIGSRPTKRVGKLAVSGLRAIPWILCWTQTRILFPTWWGTGSAWAAMNERQREELKKSFAGEPVFTSYVKALGFTLAKVEMPVWRLYVERSPLSPEQKRTAVELFETELAHAKKFFAEVTGQPDLTWFKPWLGESIRLRSPMIHPLNALQILAHADGDDALLRLTVTGISAGMQTTG